MKKRKIKRKYGYKTYLKERVRERHRQKKKDFTLYTLQTNFFFLLLLLHLLLQFVVLIVVHFTKRADGY